MTVLTTQCKELEIELFTAMQLCEIVNTPRSLAVFLMLKHRQFQDYLDLTIDANNYSDSNSFRDDYLVTKVLSKSPNLPVDIDRQAVAIAAFKQSETRCKEMNHFFRCTPDTALPPYWFTLKRNISLLLPPLNEEELNTILDLCGHGPGSTTGVRGVGSSMVEKYQSKIDLTANLIPFARSIMGDNWFFCNNNSLRRSRNRSKRVVRGSKFTTVPKTAKTDRGICVEPTLNVFLQKGIGAYIRKRLRLFGLDLDRQTERNRDAAQRAYRDSLATIDLSAASDSISLALVERLFPPDWFHLIKIARSPCVKLQGEYHELEKVSSMGNGFTFELESMIFYMLARSMFPCLTKDELCVFGDDIILPQKYAKCYIKALDLLGFSVNGAKSFLGGKFFESCGTDYYEGKLVRPFFLKGKAESIPYTVSIANRLRVYCRYGEDFGCDHRFRPLWLYLLKRTPRSWRQCRVPEFLGDIGLITSEAEVLHKRKLKHGHEGFRIKTMKTPSVLKRYEDYGVLLNSLTSSSTSEAPSYGFLPLRGLFGVERPRWTIIYWWPSGLDWDL